MSPSSSGADQQPRAATLADVAKAAEVHFSTVSRVLNGSPSLNIRPETRERILRVAAELRYRPNAIARGLRLASTGALGLLVPSLRNPVYSEIIRGAFERAWARNFVVVLAEDSGASDSPRAYERLVVEGRIDGLLIASARPGNPVLQLSKQELAPCVFVNRRYVGGGQNVSMREEDAGRLAAAHLIELGHKSLGHVAGPADLDTAHRRMDGFVEGAKRTRRKPAVVHGRFDERSGYAALEELMGRRSPPTGVFVSNLNQAVGVLASARAAGIEVPRDLSIVTYDDDPLGEYVDPALTAIRMPLYELGVAGVDALLDRLDGARSEDIVLERAPELVVRASTGPAPS